MILPKSYLCLLSPASLCLCAGFLLYALFSSPTPDQPALYEFFTAITLLSGITFLSVRGWESSRYSFEQMGLIFGVYVFSITVFRGFGEGHDTQAVLRDIVAVSFVFLPLVFIKFADKRELKGILIMSCIFIGTVFSTREISSFGNTELLYLANSPTVLFTAIFLFGLAVQKMSQVFTLKNIIVIAVCLSLSCVCVTAMGLNLQRAPLALFVISAIAMGVVSMRQSLLPLCIMVIGTLFLINYMELPLSFLLFDFLEKQRLSGLNMRLEEAGAVIEHLGQNPMNLLFGLGWGASFSSPAVAGIWVSFTHNFFTALLLKAGLIGVLLSAVYIGYFIKMLWQVWQKDLLLTLALAAPFLIGISLYANYKSLGFGLILSIIALTHHERKEKHSIY